MIDDGEIRGVLLQHFHGRRDANGGWCPTDEILLSPHPVSRAAIANACQDLADAGYILWEPFKPPMEQHAIGRARITGTGKDVVTGARPPSIDIRFPGMHAPMSDAALTEIREVVSTIRAELPALWLSNSAKADITADINHIEIETDRPTPSSKFLKAFLESLRDNLAKALANGLVALIAGLIAKYFHLF